MILVEGATEKALLPALRRFLERHLSGKMPRLQARSFDGRLPKEKVLQRWVKLLLQTSADHVIALSDVYTGSDDFFDAADAKAKMKRWVGKEKRFHAHVALHEFEAWLLPFWIDIKKNFVPDSDREAPGQAPESVNHDRPPSRHLEDLFRSGSKDLRYSKVIHARKILEFADLTVAINACPELKALVNTILTLAGGAPLTPPATASPSPGRSRSIPRTPPPA